MRRRRLIIAVVTPCLLAVLAIVIVMRKKAAPEAVRLLPDSDAVVYVNCKWIRVAARLTQVSTSGAEDGKSSLPMPITDADSDAPEYAEFMRATGFDFRRDLDEVALAIHPQPPAPAKSTQELEQRYRYSEIFVAHFEAQRLIAYVKGLSAGIERYRDIDIFVIPHEGRTVRVAILSPKMVAVSNLEDNGAIHGMVDRFRYSALPVGESMLVRNYRFAVPLGTPAWAIVKTAPADAADGASKNAKNDETATLGARPVQAGIQLPSPLREWTAGSVLVVSLRAAPALQLRAELFAGSPDNARRIVENAGSYLNLYRSIDANMPHGGSDPDVKALMNSFQLEQQSDRVVLTAGISPGFLKKMLRDSSFAAERNQTDKSTQAPDVQPSTARGNNSAPTRVGVGKKSKAAPPHGFQANHSR